MQDTATGSSFPEPHLVVSGSEFHALVRRPPLRDVRVAGPVARVSTADGDGRRVHFFVAGFFFFSWGEEGCETL